MGRVPRIELPSGLERRWQALRHLEAAVQEALDRALQNEHGLSVSEYTALAALAYSDDDGHLRQQVLAEAIPLRQSSVSRLVARLERMGLTERFHCPTDRRGVYTQITDRGRDVVTAARATYVGVLQQALGELSGDRRLAALIEQLHRDTDPANPPQG
ncbi:MarR family transcriptional regulator [Nonomuraea sp. FMUSA5-5]|uniref:MarR family transcriptional regulator n=1 Tax=Nonomuraea composti TaxID=2720023 RepID=A0ABX1BBN1_9ACTN|nr:MarR family transcriptional regulator [Nonomuraea sp. FMUSA5-5]NJP92553.1 MarR family transcriptional regulator [Nonomuraea sp. FMUSA5-5]